jgi:hypothetical protein
VVIGTVALVDYGYAICLLYTLCIAGSESDTSTMGDSLTNIYILEGRYKRTLALALLVVTTYIFGLRGISCEKESNEFTWVNSIRCGSQTGSRVLALR